MTGLYIVVISLMLALFISLALASPLIWALRIVDRTFNRSRKVLEASASSDTVSVIDIQASTPSKPSFVLGPQLALAAALTVTVVTIPVSTSQPVVCVYA